MDMEAFYRGLCGRLWTCVDTVCRSTDQEVGDSSSSGRATETLVLRGFRCVRPLTAEERDRWFWLVPWSIRDRSSARSFEQPGGRTTIENRLARFRGGVCADEPIDHTVDERFVDGSAGEEDLVEEWPTEERCRDIDVEAGGQCSV